MKKLTFLLLIAFFLVSCSPSSEQIAAPVQATLAAIPTVTPYSTNTPYPTYTPNATYTPLSTQTPYPTYTVQPTKVKVVTPTNQNLSTTCKPIKDMDYSDNMKASVKLQSYVSDLPDVKSVSYVIPERLYSNTLSQLYFVQYVSKSDSKVYAKRYIVFVKEFGWKRGVFSLDGQCWIDPMH